MLYAKFFDATERKIKRLKKWLKIDKLLFAVKNNSAKKLTLFMESCNQAHCQSEKVPYLSYHNNPGLKLSYNLEMLTLNPDKVKKKKLYKILKKLFDLTAAFLALIILFPIIVIIAILIKINSSGSAFFKHKRVGKDGKLFRLYKFRTMREESNPYAVKPQSLEDPRITKVGKFLRKSGLDEMPQLINVLKGEMSIVGPRPEMPFIVKQYNSFHRERLQVKPGITGVWQISGKRGETIHKNMEYDIFYIHNNSLTLDLAIIWKTIFIFLKVLLANITSYKRESL